MTIKSVLVDINSRVAAHPPSQCGADLARLSGARDC
jgi:hypothetical protein